MRSICRRTAPGLAVLLAFLALAVLLKLSLWSSPLTRISGAFGAYGWNDPFNAVWYLAWTPHALSRGTSPFTSDYLNYPTGVNLTWNTFMPAMGILLWPVTALGGALLSDNLLTTLAPAVAGVLAYLAIRRYVPGRLWAAAGGLLYAFSPFMMAQDPYHVQNVTAAALIPLALILADEALVRQRLRPWLLGLVIAACGILEYYVLEEYLITEALAALVLAAILAVSHPREAARRWRYAATAAGVAAPLVAAAIAYPLALQLAGPNRPTGSLHDPTAFVTDLANLVVPTATQWLAPSAAVSLTQSFTGNLGEWCGYVGIGLLALGAGTALLRRHDPAVRAAGIFTACLIVLSLGPYLHVGGHQTGIPLPFWVIYKIPLVKEVMASRLMVYAYLGLGVLLAAALESLWRRRLRLAWVPAVAVVALVPLVPAPLPSEPVSQPARLASAISAIPPGTAVLTVPSVYPPPVPSSVRFQDGVAWQAATGMRFRLVGGYFFGSPSPGQEALLQLGTTLAQPGPPAAVTPKERATILSELARSRVGAVLLASVPDPPSAIATMSGVLGRRPTMIGDVALWLLPTARSR